MKYQIEEVIPIEVAEEEITNPNSRVITKSVLETAKSAGGDGETRGCVIYCLLVCLKWFELQSLVELWDAEVHESRMVACESLAKRL